MDFDIATVSGTGIGSVLDELAALRISVFREWPYLYDGDLEYERDYLGVYTRSESSIAILARENGRLVGASTGLPMRDESAEFRQPLAEAGFPAGRVFYFGESIVLPGFRGRGLGKRFFSMREAHARRAIPNLEFTCFCAVDRPDDHPARPAEYRPLDGFWEKRGYRREPSLVARYPWKDIGDDHETLKPLTFWLKRWT